MAGRTISIRLTVAEAQQVKQQLEALGAAGASSLDRITAASAKARAAAAAANQAIVNGLTGVRSSDDGATERRRADAFAALGGEVDRLRARYVPLAAEQQRYKASLQEIAAAERQGALSAAEANAARQRTKDAFAAQVTAQRAATEATRGAAAAAEAHAGSVARQRQQFTQLIPQFNDVVASLGSGAPVMQVLLQQGSQITQIYGGVRETFAAIPRTIAGATASMAGFAGPAAIGAVAVGLGAMAVSAERAERRLETLTQRARATRDDFAAAGKEIEAAAKAAAATGTIGRADARGAAQAIRNSGGFAGGEAELRGLIGVAQDLARVLGTDVPGAAQRLAEGLDAPAAAAKRLADEGFRSLDVQTVRLIERLQNQGREVQAQAVLLDKLRQATAGADAARTPLEQGMRDLAKALTGVEQSASDFIKQIGGGLTDAFGQGLTAVAEFIEGTKREATKLREVANGLNSGKTGQGDSFGERAWNFLTDPNNPILVGVNRLAAPTAPGYTGPGSRAPASSARAPGEPATADYAAMRDRIAREYGLDPDLARRLNAVEGRLQADGTWAPGAGTSARGGFQVLTGTYNDMARRHGLTGDRTSPENDIRAGLLYYREQLQAAKGDPSVAYYAYHDGPGVLRTGTPSRAAQAGADRLLAGYNGPVMSGYTLPQPPSRDELQRQQQSRRQLDTADRQVLAAGGTTIQRQNLGDRITGLQGAIANPDATTEQVKAYREELARLQGTLNETLTPQEAFLRGLKDQIVPLQAVFEGDRKLVETRQRIAEIERSTGTQFTAAQRREAEALALAAQNAQFSTLVVNLDREEEAQQRVATAYGKGYGEVARVTAETKAYTEALRLFPAGSEQFTAAFDALTQAYRDQARAAGEAKIAAGTAENRDQLAYLERQTELIGASEEVRNRELALMRARQELVRADIPLEGEHAQAYLSSVAAMSEANSRLSRMNEVFSELQNIGTQAFDRIGSAITEAFVSGGDKAVDFGSIVKDIISQIVQQITRLAVINPIINTLFGGNRATLSDTGGLLGAFGGGAAAFASGGVSGGSGGLGDAAGGTTGSGGGVLSGLFGQVKQVGQAQSIYKSFTGGGSGSTGTGIGFVDNVLNYQLVSGGQTAATTSALQGLGSGVYGPATAAQVTTAAGGYVPTGLTAGTALTSVAAVGGGLYSAYQGFKAGGAGGITQGVTGVAGAGIAAAGAAASAGLLGSGALAAGAAAAGPYAPLVIAAGVILSSILGSGNKPNPYATTSIDAVNGRLQVGRTDSQLIKTDETVAQAQKDVENFNAFLDAAKVNVLKSTYYDARNPNRVFGIGEKVEGFEQHENFEGGVAELRFGSNDPYLDKVLQGRGFASSQEFTAFVTNARVEIDRLKETLEELRDPLKDPENAGNLKKAIDALNDTYEAARAQAEKYGMSVEGLSEAQAQAAAAIQEELYRTVQDAQESIRIRGVSARGDTQAAELYNFDLSAEQQRRAWREQLTGLWGDAFAKTDDFKARMAVLEDTLAAERLAVVQKFAQEAIAAEEARAQAEHARQIRLRTLGETMDSLWGRLATAEGDPQKGELMAFEANARAEWRTLSEELVSIYGDSFRQTEDYAARMALLERVQGAERLAIVQKYTADSVSAEQQAVQERLAAQERADQEAARAREQAEQQARGAAAGVLANLADYARSLRSGDFNPASPTAQYEDAARQFQAVSGAAAAGDYRSASELTGYADTLLAASREVNGSGLAYARDFDRVQQALQGVADVRPDVLTASAAAEQAREQTVAITDSVARLEAQLVALRRELAQQTRAA